MKIMLNKSNYLDFIGEDIYVGIDVHKKNWKITIQTDEVVCRTFTQDPEVRLLSNYLKRNYPNASYYCAYEAGFSGFWIQQQLEKENISFHSTFYFFTGFFESVESRKFIKYKVLGSTNFKTKKKPPLIYY